MSEANTSILEPDDEAADASLRDTEIQTAESDAAPVDEVDEASERCANCGVAKALLDGDWCPACGYYSVLGTFIEPDTAEEDVDTTVEDVPLWQKVPGWAYTLAALLVGLTVLSFLSWVLTAEASMSRMTWSMTQLGVGFLCFCVAHLGAYVHAIIDDSSLGLGDIFLKPINVWSPTIQDLPKSRQRLLMACCGAYAALLSVVVVGGLPYDSLWNWGPEKRAEMNLVHAITENAQVEPAEGDLEESVEAFAGQAGASDLAGKKPEAEEKKPTSRRRLDCVVLGYTVEEDDTEKLDAVILGALIRGKFRIVGSVSRGMSEEVRARLTQRLPQVRRPTPFVRSRIVAKWVEPVVTCRVSFADWSSSGKMTGAEITEFLAEVN